MGPAKIPTYLEISAKRAFAGAVEWRGWCRSGRGEVAALVALHDSAPRYARVLRGTRLGFDAPEDASALHVVERLDGDGTTDFGAPSIAPKADARTVDDAELKRLSSILKAGWRSFDAAVEGAGGRRSRRVLAAAVATCRRSSTTSWTRRGATSGCSAGRSRPDRSRPGRTDPRGGPQRARGNRAPGPPAARSSGRQAVAAPVLRPSRRVACTRSRMGDRGSGAVSVRGRGVTPHPTVPGTVGA
jgi:hypothetical protein